MTDITNLKEVNVLIGANKAGKSNVIEALTLLRSLADKDKQGRRPFANYVFDQSTKNKVVLDIELWLSQEEIIQICLWLSEHNSIFGKVNSARDLIFKNIKYHAEIEKIRNANENDITEEELYISNNTSSYTQLVHRFVENGSANQYYCDLA